MFDGLFIVSIIGNCYKAIKNAFEPTIPAENWANKELYYQDVMNGVSAEQRMKNVQNGKYKMEVKYPEPHRDPVSGKIMIENYELYKADILKYDGYKVYTWLHQGKYNLSPEEVEKRMEEYKKKLNRMCSFA